MDVSRLEFVIIAFLILTISGCRKEDPTAGAPVPPPKKVQDPPPSSGPDACQGQVIPNSFIIKWKKRVPDHFRQNGTALTANLSKVTGVTKAEIEATVLTDYSDEIEMAEPDYYVQFIDPKTEITPAETTTTAWGPESINSSAAWNFLGKKGDGILVAVVDTGLDVTHELLKDQIWQNPGESGLDANGKDKSTNGLDDDGNGFVDDVNGWNFAGNNPQITDSTKIPHGSHVSGIIAGAQSGNGFVGIAPNAKLMGLKFMDDSGGGSISTAVASLDYALQNHARVVNASWGGRYCSKALKEKFEELAAKNVLLATAAGNDGRDLSYFPEWPAAFIIPGKITVGAVNKQGILTSFSNYGALVDLAAPGDEILSTIPATEKGNMAVMRGTSMATPFVSGVAALLMSKFPNRTAAEIAEAINNSAAVGDNIGVRTHGRLDALSAAKYLH